MDSVPSPANPTDRMPANNTPLQPTWIGFVSDTREALLLFEAVLQGQIARVTRRPHDRERTSLIRSGSVFIYEEGASGIKRWTDGVPWSPSRILGNFLIYRELEKPFPPGEKKRARPKPKSDPFDNVPIKPETGEAIMGTPSGLSSSSTPVKSEPNSDRDSTRSLVGSLTDSYQFKEMDGLVKKTMSVTLNGTHYHLVSYYNPEDVKSGRLKKPMDCDLRYLQIRGDLIHGQNFRAPLEDTDDSMQASPPFAAQAQASHYVATASHASYMGGSAYVHQSMQQANYQQASPYHLQQMQQQQPPPQPTQHQQQPQQHRHQHHQPQADSYAPQRRSLGYSSPAQQQGAYSQIQHAPPIQAMRPEYGQFPQYSDPRTFPHQGQASYGQQPSMHPPPWHGNQS